MSLYMYLHAAILLIYVYCALHQISAQPLMGYVLSAEKHASHPAKPFLSFFLQGLPLLETQCERDKDGKYHLASTIKS